MTTREHLSDTEQQLARRSSELFELTWRPGVPRQVAASARDEFNLIARRRKALNALARVQLDVDFRELKQYEQKVVGQQAAALKQIRQHLNATPSRRGAAAGPL